jgi:hypothetical protein
MKDPADADKQAADAEQQPKLVKPFTPLSLFGKAAAQPPEPAKEWDAVLRCHRCSGRFTIHHLPLKRIALVPQIASCPHCEARSSTTTKKLHHIVDLRQTKD